MGISGLLPLLKDIQVHGNISAFKGQRLAVDAYVWLHKGAFGCAEELVKGKKTTKFVDYAMHRVRLLRHYGITPYIVFDGGPLPAKKGTENHRAQSRTDNLAKAQALESQGRAKDARDCYTKCVDITPEMAYQLIKALRAEEVDYVVAPYEADAQLCFLEREGFVDGIITEDSDLLVFGCRQVIFKLDGNGDCVSIHRDRLATISDFPMHGWTDVQFRRMAMLSGCDYLPSIPGIGIKTAHRLLRRYKTVEKLLQQVRLEGQLPVPIDYTKKFAQAELAFLYQRVYNPEEGRLVPLNDFPEGGLQGEDEMWVGLDVSVEIAQGIAKGDLHPETFEAIEDQWPDFKPVQRKMLVRPGSSTTIPLGQSSKQNIQAGPMDAFISRSKRLKSAPLPKPVGTFPSGPSRLSAQSLWTTNQENTLDRESISQVTRPVKKSKFFSKGGTESRDLEISIELESKELIWERSDGPDLDFEGSCTPKKGGGGGGSRGGGECVSGGNHRGGGSGAGSSRARSPSPVLSEWIVSSPVGVEIESQESEGLVSSPDGTPVKVRNEGSLTAFEVDSPLGSLKRSRSRSRTRSLSPIPSPTRFRREVKTEFVMETARPDDSCYLTQDVPTPINSGYSQTPKSPTQRHYSGRSIMVPESSPGVALRDEEIETYRLLARQERMLGSSDGVEAEEMERLITPFAPSRAVGGLGPSVGLGKVEDDEEIEEIESDDEAEEREREREREREKIKVKEREEQAKLVAAGWRAKYALKSGSPFPQARSSRVMKSLPARTASKSTSPPVTLLMTSKPTARRGTSDIQPILTPLGERRLNINTKAEVSVNGAVDVDVGDGSARGSGSVQMGMSLDGGLKTPAQNVLGREMGRERKMGMGMGIGSGGGVSPLSAFQIGGLGLGGSGGKLERFKFAGKVGTVDVDRKRSFGF